MMNSRTSSLGGVNAQNRRGPTPSSLSISSNPSPSNTGIHAKQTISVEEWERRAPLSDLQMRSVAQIAKASEYVPLPLKFLEESPPGTPTPGRPVNKHLQQNQDVSRPSTPGISGASGSAHALHPSQPIQTPQQFYDWFTLVDRSVAHSQEAHYRAHLASLDEQLAMCDLLSDRIGEIERELDGMLEGWRGVEEGGKSLKGACERLLEERDNLLQVVDDLGAHLDYFQELDHATRMLNHPGESLIFEPDFHYMVERVDLCIDFLKVHRHYREAEVYLLRFHQCMTRAMTLIKMSFVGSLRAVSSEISKVIFDNEVSSMAQQHLLYTRFRTVSSKAAPLLMELERRARKYPEELGSLLSECHSAYFSIRKSLLVPRIIEEIKGLDPKRSELVDLTRSGCSYLKQLCTDEFSLYLDFFTTGQAQLYQYLESLCDLLYDDLRPRILHEPRLTVLCEVCTVLQALMVLDATSTPIISSVVASSESSDDDSDDEGTSGMSQQSRLRKPSQSSDEFDVYTPDNQLNPETRGSLGRRLHIGHLLRMILQDAQTRLFFKAQAVVQSEIRHYVPNPNDLKWPDILLATLPPSDTLLQEKQSMSQIFQTVSTLQRQDTWFPSLRRTVWVLSQLRDFIKPAIFEDIAQEAVAFCRISLLSAADLIKTQQQDKSLDGALFLVRHLLILKEVLASLEADLKSRAEESDTRGFADTTVKSPTTSRTLEFGGISATVGVGGVTETLTNMLSKTTSLLPEGLFASLGVARGPDGDLRGVKLDIDQSLRKACEDVIVTCSQFVCEPLEKWSNRVATLKEECTRNAVAASSRNVSTSTSPRYQPSFAEALSEAPNAQMLFLEGIQRDLRSAIVKVKLYLDDVRTVKILLEHVVGRIEAVYERFGDALFEMKKVAIASDVAGGEMQIVSSSALREILRSVCGDASLSFPA